MKNRSKSASFKKWFLSSILVGGLLGLLVSGCSNPSGGSGSQLVLNLTKANLIAGGPALLLTASQQVTWTSSDPAVASVSASGLVTPLTKGKTVITATSGSSTATCAVSSNVLLLWGNVETADGTIPVYWMDNVLHTLPVGTGTLIHGDANNALIVGTDIYFGGHLTDATGASVPVYWKNGVLNFLTVPAGHEFTGDWVQPTMDASGNLYFRGTLHHVQNDVRTDDLGEWFNGTWTPLNMTLPNGAATNGMVNSEFVGPDGTVVFAGSLYDVENGRSQAVYWTGISGTPTVVSTSSLSSYGGFVTAMIGPPTRSQWTILLAGNGANGGFVGGYSVNGTVTPLSMGPAVGGIMWWAYTDDSGVTYATGNAGPMNANFWTLQFPVYWRNWKAIALPLPNGYPYGTENGGAYKDSTGALYFTGRVWNSVSGIPVYWADGQVYPLPIGDGLGGSGNGYVAAVDF